MAQAGVLGKLVYRENEHGWTLDVGAQLLRYDLLSGSLTDDEVPNIAAARRDLVDNVNRMLSKRNFRYRVPEIALGVNQIQGILEEILDEMAYRCTSSHIACLLIGAANYSLGFMPAAESKYASEMSGLALNRLMSLDIHCEDLGINGFALFDRMAETVCDGLSIRRLLLAMRKPMVILMVTSEPKDGSRLRLLEEQRSLEEALRSSSIRDGYELKLLPSCRPRDIGPALKLHRPTILHFSGHGSRSGLSFEDEGGNEQTVDIRQLGSVLSLAKTIGLKGVVMNACHTESQAEVIANAVGHVVAMEGPVSDKGAISFARAFYGCLGDGLAFDQAYTWALAETGLDSTTGRLRPHLITATPSTPISRGHSPQPARFPAIAVETPQVTPGVGNLLDSPPMGHQLPFEAQSATGTPLPVIKKSPPPRPAKREDLRARPIQH